MDSSSHHPRQSQGKPREKPCFKPMESGQGKRGQYALSYLGCHAPIPVRFSHDGLGILGACTSWKLGTSDALPEPLFWNDQQYNIKIKIGLFLYIVDCLLGSCHVLIQPIRPRSAMTFVAGQHRDNSCSQSSDSQRRGAEQSKEGWSLWLTTPTIQIHNYGQPCFMVYVCSNFLPESLGTCMEPQTRARFSKNTIISFPSCQVPRWTTVLWLLVRSGLVMFTNYPMLIGQSVHLKR